MTESESRVFESESLEAAFQSDLRRLQAPAPFSGNNSVILLVTLALFVLSQLDKDQTAVGIAALVGVLLFHEMGHLVGMKLFGYRNVKMFFIPFFGAAVSGKRQGMAGWKEAVTLLLGPLPGIILGCALVIKLQIRPSPMLHALASVMIMVNAFNLIPVMPLDGGRFFHLLLFCRHRYLEITFAALAALVLIASGLLGLVVLPILGVLMLLGLRMQWRLLKSAQVLRDQFVQWDGDPEALPQPQLRAAFLAAHALCPVVPAKRPSRRADVMESLIERAALQPPGIMASLLLVLPWLIGVVGSVLAIAMLSPPKWQERVVAPGGFSVMFPSNSAPSPVERDGPLGMTVMQSLDANGSSGQFTVRWYDLPTDRIPANGQSQARFLDVSRDKVLQRIEGIMAEEVAIPNGRQILIHERDGFESWARIQIVGRRVYLLYAPVEPADETKRFFESFKLSGS